MQRKILSKTLWAENLHERRAAYTFAAATGHTHTARQRLNTEEKVIKDKYCKTPMQRLYYDSCIYKKRLTPLAASLVPYATTKSLGIILPPRSSYICISGRQKQCIMEIISMDSRVFDNIVHRIKSIEQKTISLCQKQEDLALKDWLDNQEVCQILSISPRTLQTYRDKGIISFSCIRQKIYYRPEDVEKVLRLSYHKAHGK